MSALDRAIARPEPVHEFSATSPLDGLRRRSVGAADVLAQSVAAVAPTAAATTVILLVAGISVQAVVVSILIAGVLSVFIARTVGQFARRFAAAGSVYTYTVRGLGPTAGMAAGASLLIGYGAISMFALLGGAYYLTFILQSVWPELPSTLAIVASLLGQVLVLAIVLVRGIRVSARVALVVETASVAIIAALLIVLLVRIGPVPLDVLLPLGELSPGAVAAGSVVALTAFVGFESSATLGVEAKTPLRTVPRAILWTVLVSMALYTLAAVTQVAGFASLGRDLAASSSPVNELAVAFGLGNWGALADVGIAASFLACAIASTTALTRVLFTLGRESVLPAALGTAHRRNGAPTRAIALVVPVIAAVPVLLIVSGVGIWDGLQMLVALAGSGYIVAYVLMCVAAPVFLHRIGELTVGSAVVAIVSAISLTAALISYLAVAAHSGNAGAWAALAIAVIMAMVVWWRRGRVPGGTALGAYDEPVAAHVLGGVPRNEAAPSSSVGRGG